MANENSIVLLAEAINKLGLPEAANYYAVALKNKRFKNDPAPWNQLGIIFTGKKQLGKAIECFIGAYRIEPDNHQTALNLGIFLDKYLEKKTEAKKYYAKYLRLTEKNPALEAKREEIAKRMKEI